MFTIMNCHDAKKLMEANHCYILDVRDEKAYQDAHIPGAEYVGREQLVRLCEDGVKTRPVLVYCYKGMRSQMVAQVLIQAGFEKVYSLEGGFAAWENIV